ncbi:MAG: hypothetical protein K2K41_02700 [Ruminiclostridium sp.]|nr:hypothetical protein [Ruminiclostridium sp.]
MLTKKVKRGLISLLLTSALMLSCGCQITENNPQLSDINTSTPLTDKDDTITTIPDKDEIVTTVTESETDTTVTESEPVTTPTETTEKVLEPIPEEWIRIEDHQYALDHFDEIMNTSNSTGDIRDMISSLVHKNILYYYTLVGETYRSDWENPIGYGDDETFICAAESEHFPDVKSIYELASSIYDPSTNKACSYDPSTNTLYWPWALPQTDKYRVFFTEIDGQMYVNKNCGIFRGGPYPFTGTSYIEITEQTEDICKLTWHYPDVERLIEPDKYVDYYYFEGHFTAEYIDGAWKLDSILCY